MKTLFFFILIFLSRTLIGQFFAGAGLGTNFETLAVNPRAEFIVGSHASISAYAYYPVLKPANLPDFMTVNADFHYYMRHPLEFNYYPLAGIGIIFILENPSEQNITKNYFCLNAGGGVSFPLSSKIYMYLEGALVTGAKVLRTDLRFQTGLTYLF